MVLEKAVRGDAVPFGERLAAKHVRQGLVRPLRLNPRHAQVRPQAELTFACFRARVVRVLAPELVDLLVVRQCVRGQLEFLGTQPRVSPALPLRVRNWALSPGTVGRRQDAASSCDGRACGRCSTRLARPRAGSLKVFKSSPYRS